MDNHHLSNITKVKKIKKIKIINWKIKQDENLKII